MSRTKHAGARGFDWFHAIPRHFFRYPTWHFSTYFGSGYMLAGVLHHRIWSESQQVETVFTNLGLGLARPSPNLALLFFSIAAAVASVLLHAFLVRLNRRAHAAEFVFWGTAVSMGAAWVPWLFASSVVTTVFLFLFGMTAVAGFAIVRRLLKKEGARDGQLPFDPWKMFANATKACAAVVAVVLGAIATTALLPWRETHIEGRELFRYACLSAWMILGMLAFILMPLFVKAFEEGPSDEVEFELPGPI